MEEYKRNLFLALAQAENILLLAKEFANEGAQDDTPQADVFKALEEQVDATLGQLYMSRSGMRKLQGEQYRGYEQ